jgi:hypothetical protein
MEIRMEKYVATIHGNVIEWEGDEPDNLNGDNAIKVEVRVIDVGKVLPKSDGKKMAEALQQLAKLGGVKSIPDPLAWQREIRQDRPLPGRD